jgi:hypothetical protein
MGSLVQEPGDSDETALPTAPGLLLGWTLRAILSQLVKVYVQWYFGDLQCFTRVPGFGGQSFAGPLLLQSNPKSLTVANPTRSDLFAQGKEESQVKSDACDAQRRDYRNHQHHSFSIRSQCVRSLESLQSLDTKNRKVRIKGS